jgi:hypothetical protein
VKALALHFPRERNGRFLRAAVVALASLDGAIPNGLGKCVPRPAAGSLNIVPWHTLG